MKSPLSYQLTEYDCGPTTVLNAMNVLFEREELPPEVIKFVMLYCMDGYNENGEACKSGTTCMAMRFLASWLNHYREMRKWPIYCEVINGEAVYMGQNSRIAECLQLGGVVIARVMLECWHYVLLTGMDEDYVYLFDPYYRTEDFEDIRVTLIDDAPCRMNRRITYEILNSEGTSDYALGAVKDRECVLMYNRTTKLSTCSIEYMI